MIIDHNQTPAGEALAPHAVETAQAPDQIETVAASPVAESVNSTHGEIASEPSATQSHAPTDAPVADASNVDASVESHVEAVPTSDQPATPVSEVSTAPEVKDVASASEVSAESPVATPAPEVDAKAEAAEAVAPESVGNVVPVAETPAATAPANDTVTSTQSAQNDADLFDSYMSGDIHMDVDAPEGGYKRLNKGDRIEATIIQVDRDKVFVDLGTKAEGIVPLSELSEENLETAKGHFNVGDKISVIVLRPEGAEGNPIVSKKKADFEFAWDLVEEAFRSQEMITANVVDRVKGGLVVDVGVRGFVPATHVGSGKLRNIEKYVGQPLQLKVIEIDRERKKVVLSNRQAEEERRAAAKDSIFKDVKSGDRLFGTVRRLTDYGAFVDLGGVDGLLHISEMSWARINHPKEMFKEGQKIEVMVLRLDSAAGKISLGHRQVLPDPWNLIKENYKNGQNLKVTIGRLVQSGAFIKLPEGAEAFMPVSEMSFRRIKRPQDVVEENQEVEVQIIDLRPEERRMVLSMRALGGGGDLRQNVSVPPTSGYEEDMRRADRSKGAKKGKKTAGGRGREEFEDFEEVAGRRGFATGGATIGERLGMLKGFLGREDDDEDSQKESEPEEE